MDLLTVRIKRYIPENKDFIMESHQIPFEKGMSLLMVLENLYEEKGIHFRHSCDVGLCTICIVKVNGKNRLACKEIIDNPDKILTVEPVDKFTPIKDLVVALDER